MDDEELVEMLIRGWALHCAATSMAGRAVTTQSVLDRASKFEAYIRGPERES